MLLPRLGNAPPRGRLFLADGLRGLEASPVTAPGSPNPCRLLVTVTALLSSLPLTSGHFHRCSPRALSQPFSEACGLFEIWPDTQAPGNCLPSRRRPVGFLGSRSARQGTARPLPALLHLLCLKPASTFLWWSRALLSHLSSLVSIVGDASP